jgi:competence protein ComEC
LQKIQELIVEEIASQKARAFLWIPVFFAVGIATYFALKFEPSLWIGFGTFIVSTLISFIIWKIQNDTLFLKFTLLIAAMFAITTSGFFIAQVRSHLVYTPMIVKKMSPVGVNGFIESIEPLGEGEGSRVVLTDLKIERLSPEETPRKIRLKIRKDDGLQNGQRIKLLTGLNPPSGPVAPYAFDFQRMAYFKGIGAVGFSYTTPEIMEEAPERFFSLKNTREAITENLRAQSAEPQQSIIVALMTGQRGQISDENWRALRESGLAHLLAISGLHVGMVAGVIFFFSRLIMASFQNFTLKYPIKKYAAVIALFGAFFYTLMVGATIPTQRALLMTGLVMVAIMLDRSPFSLRLVALAALVVLFFSPESLTSVSFQMSFAAVTALICFYDWLRPVWKRLHRQASMTKKFILYFIGVSLTTIIAGFATGLFALFHFQNFAVYGVLANMVAVPLMAFIVMPMIVFSYVLMPLGLEGLIMPLIEWGVGWILATAHFVSKLDGAVWLIPAWPHWIFIMLVLCFWAMIVWKGRLKVFLIPMIFLLISFIFLYKQPDILVSSKTYLIAVRGNQGSLWLLTGQKERYTAENWLRINGQDERDKQIWPKEGSADNFPLSCDNFGCRGEIENYKVSIAFTNKAWQEDCDWADILISQNPVEDKTCDAKHIIDFFDVWRNGAYAVWLTPEKVKMKNVRQTRGQRLWTQIAG